MKKIIATFVGLLVIMLGYQNCSQKEFQSVDGSSKISSTGFSTGSSTSGLSGSGTDVTIETDGPIVNIQGSCDVGTQIDLSGDLLTDVGPVGCDNEGTVNFCSRIKKHYDVNIVNVETIGAGQTIDVEEFTVSNQTVPMTVFTVDTFVKRGLKLDVTGRCTAGSSMTFTLYNREERRIVCEAVGTYTVTNLPLINTTPRILYITMRTIYGVTRTIAANVDGENEAVNCAITETEASARMCANQAGLVKGTCKSGYPVEVLVDGVVQDSALCNSGRFTSTTLLLAADGQASQVEIRQKNAYGKSCSSKKSMANF